MPQRWHLFHAYSERLLPREGARRLFFDEFLRLKVFFFNLLSPFGSDAKTVTAIIPCDFDGGTEQHVMVCCQKSATRGKSARSFDNVALFYSSFI